MLRVVFTSMPSRRLIIPLDDRELAVAVDGDTAVLDVGLRRPPPPGPEPADPPDDEPPVRFCVPARALVAALRVAWADEHDLRCFEPWRDTTRDGRWRGYEPYDGGDRWFDDLGDGDPSGYRDPTVVPFRLPEAPPRPSRSGAAWEDHEHETVREMWLTAEPDADKNELVRAIATRLDRGVGGISARLRLAGCDPTRPGSGWDGRWGGDEPEDAASQRGGAVGAGGTTR